ncbi:MAG: DNA polymerase III subunit gamma/tau [Deltaproteobacteria bacterium]|nr:DNA polymerase III subunit gamma/tau [Deltaproteobacteria bacterium]
MSYLVLARKYRPQTFEDLVGQEHVARTLQNALKSGRIAHAYLFTGARGVGKTTSARILARALNCASQEGPTPTPCGHCSPCVEIAASSDLDVLEMDAASRTSVDDIRELQKTLAFVPARDRSKVYIVDEVHMLSGSAFNAFLKTLEEPPPHVKFIFATTEPHKIPVTVLSRCQRYDFRLIETAAIAQSLQSILAKEGIAADDDAVRIVAREAAGSMRDALSLMDQAVAFAAGERLEGAEVARVLGIADRRLLFDIGAAIVRRDPRAALEAVAEVARGGHDVVHFSRELLAHLRNLVVVKISSEPGPGSPAAEGGWGGGRLLDAPDSERADLVQQAKDRTLVDLERMFLAFSRAFEEIGRSATPRLLLEMAVARLAHSEPLVPIDELVGRLEALERRLAGGAAPARAAGPRPSPRAQGEAQSAPRPRSIDARALAAAPPLAAAIDRAPPPASRAATEGEPPAAEATGASPAPAPTALAPPTETLREWRAILDRVGAESRVLRSVLEHAAPLEVCPTAVRVTLPPDSLHGRIAIEREKLELLHRAVRAHFGREVPVDVRLAAKDPERPVMSSSELRAVDEARTSAERVRVAEEHPAVRAAMGVFGGAVKSVKTELA